MIRCLLRRLTLIPDTGSFSLVSCGRGSEYADEDRQRVHDRGYRGPGCMLRDRAGKRSGKQGEGDGGRDGKKESEGRVSVGGAEGDVGNLPGVKRKERHTQKKKKKKGGCAAFVKILAHNEVQSRFFFVPFQSQLLWNRC